MVFTRFMVVMVFFFGSTWGSVNNICTEDCAADYDTDKNEVSSDMDLFLDWANQNGAKFPKLIVNQNTAGTARGRTIHANEDISEGEEVLFIPEHMLMSVWRGRRTRVGSLVAKEAAKMGLLDNPGSFGEMVVVATFLLHESKDPNSFWKPYIDTFPNLSHIPTNFIELCRSELRNTNTLYRIEEKYQQAQKAYEIYSYFGQYSWYEFLQAFLWVDSRSFTNHKVGLKMVPIADLMNHRHPHHVDYSYDYNRNGYRMVARTGVRRNEEVTDTYGYPKSSGLLFASFGFVVSDSAVSAARIHISLAHYFPDFEKKKQLILRQRNALIDYPENYDRLEIKTVFEHLRIYTQPLEVSVDNQILFEVTLESEQDMLKEFIRALEAASDRMKSSLSKDEAILKELKSQGEEADSRMINLVNLRLEERNVLVIWKSFANECISILQSRTMLETSRFSSYIDRVISPLVLGEKAILS